MKDAIFCDIRPCGSCKNRHFEGKYHLYHQGDKNRRGRNSVSSNTVFLLSVLRLLVTANIPISPILVALMMEVIRSFETSVLTKTTPCNMRQDDILQCKI
jgi:hypothetical protein